MTDSEFFQLDQQQWYEAWTDAEVHEIVQDTLQHTEIFEFADILF